MIQRKWSVRVKEVIPRFFMTWFISAKIFIIYNIIYILFFHRFFSNREAIVSQATFVSNKSTASFYFDILQRFSTVSIVSIYFIITRALKHLLFLTTITSHWESVHYISRVFLTTATNDLKDYITPTESNNGDYSPVYHTESNKGDYFTVSRFLKLVSD
jgi:hypothetical protein